MASRVTPGNLCFWTDLSRPEFTCLAAFSVTSQCFKTSFSVCSTRSAYPLAVHPCRIWYVSVNIPIQLPVWPWVYSMPFLSWSPYWQSRPPFPPSPALEPSAVLYAPQYNYFIQNNYFFCLTICYSIFLKFKHSDDYLTFIGCNFYNSYFCFYNSETCRGPIYC